MAWRTSACLPKDQPRSFMRLLEQGPESQSASWICSVGPSSLMNASDLDDHSFVPSGHKVIGIKAHCLSHGICRNIGVACQNGLVQVLSADVERGAGVGA